MAKTLTLFTGLTPNIDGHPYFNIKVFANYLAYLKTNYEYKEISDDNYRINANIIKITTENLTNKLFTYAIETDGNGWHRCYFIDMITKQSNMLYLQLSIDYWGSYYLASNVDYLHITRCNRRVGVGIYDEIKIAGQEETNPEFLYFGGVAYPSQPTGPKAYITNMYNVMLVFSLSYNTEQQVFGNDRVSTTQLFCISFNDLIATYSDAGVTGKDVFVLINDLLGGVYGVDGIIGTLDAEINEAWILTQDLISFNGDDVPTIKSKSSLADDELEVQVLNVTNGIKQYRLTLHDEDYDINYDYIAGTRYANGLKLARLTNEELKFTFVCETKQNSLNVYVRQGENQFDITNNFVMEITTSTAKTTTFRKIAQSITQAGQAYKSISKAYEKGGASGAGIAGLTSIASMVSGFGVDKDIKGNGDAYITFDYSISRASLPTYNLVGTPFVITKYKSANNEIKKARYFGAQFDEIVEDINSIFEYDFLGAGDYDLTYIVANEIKIINLPTIARQAIEQAFTSGVELLDYEGTTNE